MAKLKNKAGYDKDFFAIEWFLKNSCTILRQVAKYRQNNESLKVMHDVIDMATEGIDELGKQNPFDYKIAINFLFIELATEILQSHSFKEYSAIKQKNKYIEQSKFFRK